MGAESVGFHRNARFAAHRTPRPDHVGEFPQPLA